jgi:hypothetical protein
MFYSQSHISSFSTSHYLSNITPPLKHHTTSQITMRFHKVCLLFLGIVAGASASRAAGAWQVVGFYYAYRIMIDAYGVDGNKYIAPDARGSLPDQSCTMDEFARYIYGPQQIQGWPDGLIGPSVAPDPIESVAKIEGSGWPTENYLKPQLLLPELFANPQTKPKTSPNFETQVKKMNTYVQDARAAMNSDGITQAEVAAKPEFKNLKTSLIGISQMRRQDTYGEDLEDMKTALRNAGATPVTVEVTALDGKTTFTELDAAATVQATLNDGKLKRFDAKKYKNLLNNTFLKAKKHFGVIEALDKWISDINSALQC